MARRSVVLNGLEKDIEIVTGDIKDASELFGASSLISLPQIRLI